MAPKPKFINRKDCHLNVESGIKEIGDFFGLNPSDVIKQGYMFLIEHHITRYGATSEIKAQWAEITTREAEEFRLKCELENAVKVKALQTLGKEPSLNNPHIDGSLKQIISVMSADELSWVYQAARSDQINIVRAVIPRIRNLYETRTGKTAPYWTPADELTILNELIDLSGA